MKKVKTKVETCLDCPDHDVIRDKDPHDWFCDDDMAVVCEKTPNPNKDPDSEWLSRRNDFRIVACSCRPYNLKRESVIPKWCPKRKVK